jgi:hypothetical protein
MNSPEETPTPTAAPLASALLRAARLLLRPLVRLLMNHGVTYPLLVEMLRGLYVEVALNDLLSEPRARTDSRISLLTGVHRKEIRRLRSVDADSPDVPPVVTISSQIVARWLAAPGYQDAEGRPVPLPRTPSTEGELSFDGLIGAVTTDIRPRAVLDTWLAEGMVRLDGEDRVHLNTAAFLPRAGGAAQLFYFARNLHDHLAAAAANVAATGAAPFLDRSVHYDRLTEAQALRLEAAARAAAMHAVLEVNRLALTLVDSDPAVQPEGGRRVNFGVYVFAEDEDTQ